MAWTRSSLAKIIQRGECKMSESLKAELVKDFVYHAYADLVKIKKRITQETRKTLDF
jgi:hypothetical protein